MLDPTLNALISNNYNTFIVTTVCLILLPKAFLRSNFLGARQSNAALTTFIDVTISHGLQQ